MKENNLDLKSIHVVIISLLLFISCSKKQEPVLTDQYKKWETLEIKTRFQTLTISKFSDSADYYNMINSNKEFKIIPESTPEKTDPEQPEHKIILFTKAEKDSLSKYIYESVTQPKFTNVLATDYAGGVILRFDRENMNLMCEYNSVGDWTTVSENTEKIYNLISKKVEISKQ